MIIRNYFKNVNSVKIPPKTGKNFENNCKSKLVEGKGREVP